MNANHHKPFIIPIFLPHAGCPHQCVFCNQVAITGSKQKAVDADQIRYHIHKFLDYKNDRKGPVQISFYGGNFLGLTIDEIVQLLDLATEFVSIGRVDSIRFSTRPDTITPDRLDIITAYPVETIELGVQSMDDRVLTLARRGHSAADTTLAVRQLKERKLSIGFQMMVGLPGDTDALSLITAEKIAALRPDFVRIYPTVVVENSQLAKWYRNGSYVPLSLEAAIDRVKLLYLLFSRHNVKIIRMGLQASEDLEEGKMVLAGPYHPAFGHMVYSEIFLDAAFTAIKAADPKAPAVSIFVNPRRISIMRGLRNSNTERIKKRFGFEKIDISPDRNIDEKSIKINSGIPRSCFALADKDADAQSSQTGRPELKIED
jgi:histone acetyltransferase (RNA polymerase elongator complex component)